jgi:hypothetical protein
MEAIKVRTRVRTVDIVFYVFIVIFVQNYNDLRKIAWRIGSTGSNPVGVTLLLPEVRIGKTENESGNRIGDDTE